MNPYTELAKIMEDRGAAKNSPDMEMAAVISTDPLKIRVGEVEIGISLYVNSALSLKAATIAGIVTEEAALKEALQKIYEAFSLKSGDTVLVQRMGNIFVILEKVVKA